MATTVGLPCLVGNRVARTPVGGMERVSGTCLGYPRQYRERGGVEGGEDHQVTLIMDSTELTDALLHTSERSNLCSYGRSLWVGID